MKRRKWSSMVLAASSAPIRLEVLKLLSSSGPLSYTEIMMSLQLNPVRDAGKFVYHLRNLMDAGLISLDRKTKKYGITELGGMMVKLARDVDEYVESKGGRLLVRTSRLTIEEFDRGKIVNSLVTEAGAPVGIAQEIAGEVEEKLIKLKTKYLTSPLIREFVNAVLIEKGFEEYRHRLTRLGMPLHDVARLFEDRPALTVTELERRTAHSVLKEYVLLNGVPRRVADAHLSGLIHINGLSEWTLKPDEVFHDLTVFLRRGLPPLDAPTSFGDAVALIEKLCFLTGLEVSRGVVLDSLNVYLAPFVESQDRRVLVEAFKAFLRSPGLGGYGRTLTLSLEASLPSYLKDVEAVGPGGRKEGTYQDYVEEAQTVTECLVEAVREISLKRMPTHVQVLFKMRNGVGERLAEKSLMELASKYALPYFAVCDVEEEVGFTPDGLMIGVDRVKDDLKGYLRSGNLGTVHVNIPRLHYESKGREERFFSLMESSVKAAVEALKSKRNALVKALKGRMLPLLSGEKDPYFSLEDAACVVSFVGLNEVVEARTEKPLHVAEGARYASHMVQFMGKLIKELEVSEELRIKLAQRSCEEGSERLAHVDLEKYGKDALRAEPSSPPYYTDIPLIPLSRKISLSQRVEAEASTQKNLDGGGLAVIPLRRVSVEALCGFNGQVLKAGCKAYTYTMEISHCHRCGFVSEGFLHTCPSCGAEHPIHLGRASAILQPTHMWPESRLRSSVNWVYHEL